MKISREKPCQRRHHRLQAPLHISVNGYAPLPAYDWSLSGLRVCGYQGESLNIHDEITLLITLPFQGFQISFDVTGSVVRTNKEAQSLSIEFNDLSERSFDLMNHFVDDLIRGKMASIDDTICRIDVPVTPISTSPTPNPTDQLPMRRLPIKTIVISCFYLLLGMFVFGYLALIFYSNIISLEVPTSVISTRIQTLTMPVDGILKPINFSLGAKYNKGDTLFSVENISLKNKINARKIKVSTSKIKLNEAKEQFRIESERMKLYQIVNNTDLKIIQAQLQAKNAELIFADKNFLRLKKLKQSNSVSDKQLDDAKQIQNKIAFKAKELVAKLVQVTAMNSVSERRHYNNKVFATDLDMMALKLQSLYSAVQLEQQQLTLLKEAQAEQVVRAPYNGKITTLFHVKNSNVPRNEAVLTFEEVDRSLVSAFLNQQEVMHIGLYDVASVFIPALGYEIDAVITHIDRTSGYKGQKNIRYEWRDKKDKTALVSLELLIPKGASQYITAGLPAVVIFKRRTSNNILAKYFSSKEKAPHQLNKKHSSASGVHYDSI